MGYNTDTIIIDRDTQVVVEKKDLKYLIVDNATAVWWSNDGYGNLDTFVAEQIKIAEERLGVKLT